MKYLTISLLLLFPIANQSLSVERNYQLVYDENQVLSFHITIAPEDWQKMTPIRPSPEQRGPRRLEFPYVRATVKFRDEIYENVGIRFKGSSSYSLAPDPYKKPFKLDFDRYVKKQHFHGFKKLNFHTNTSDPTMMREKLSYDLFQKAGVPTCRATFVKLHLTIEGQLEDAYLGVYTSVEQIGNAFLKTHFDDAKGMFVKRIGGGDFRYVGEKWKRYENQFELRSKSKQALIRFIKLLQQAPDAQFDAEIENWLSTDKFLSWLAVNTLLTNLDSYTAAGHNFYFYRNPQTEQFVLIPWDLSHSFGGHPFFSGTPEELANFDIFHPYPEASPKSLIVRLLEIPRYHQRYRDKLEALIEGEFSPEAMHGEINRLYRLIHEDVFADTRKEFSTEAFEMGIETKVDRPFGPPGLPPHIKIPVRQVPGLKSFASSRVKNVRAQLSGEEGRSQKGYRIQPYHPISPEQRVGMSRERATVIAGLPDHYPGIQLWQMRERLKLTTAQQERIKAILDATAEQHRPTQVQIESLQKELIALITEGKEGLAQQKAQSGERLHQQRGKILAPAFERMMRVLTQPQREAFMQSQQQSEPH